MARPKRPPPENRIRLHYINEWADHRGMSQSDIAESLSVDPGTVSRWFDGALPSEGALPRIAAMFGVDLAELFQAPGDGWLRRFFGCLPVSVHGGDGRERDTAGLGKLPSRQ